MIPYSKYYDFYDRYCGETHHLRLGDKVTITGLRKSTGEKYTLHVLDGKMHREDGPALVLSSDSNHTEYWAINDELHRTDGPAVVDHKLRRYEYYLHGNFLMFSEWVDALDLCGAVITKLMLEYPQSEYNPYLKT